MAIRENDETRIEYPIGRRLYETKGRLDYSMRVSGSARLDGREVALEEVKLRGDRLSFRLAGRKGEFSGQVKGNQIEGVIESGGTRSPWSATLGG